MASPLVEALWRSWHAVKGLFIIFCMLLSTLIYVALYALVRIPFLLWAPRTERYLQTRMVHAWVYLILSATAMAADSALVVALPTETSPEMAARVHARLRRAFAFASYQPPPEEAITEAITEAMEEEAAAEDECAIAIEGELPPSTETRRPPSTENRRPPSIETRRPPQRDMVIANHQAYMDWVYIWAFLAPLDRDAVVKIILKRSLGDLPIFGCGLRMVRFIFLRRDWERDKFKFGHRLLDLLGEDMPFSLVLFPEGTTISLRNRAKCEKFAAANGIEVAPRFTLLPRTTGMHFALNTLGAHIEGIWDLTFGLEGTAPTDVPEERWSLTGLFLRGSSPPAVHCHAKFFPIAEVPYEDATAFQAWLYARFAEKDRLLAHFYEHGRFEGPQAVRRSIASARMHGWFFASFLLSAAIIGGIIYGLVAAIVALYNAST